MRFCSGNGEFAADDGSRSVGYGRDLVLGAASGTDSTVALGRRESTDVRKCCVLATYRRAGVTC